MGGHINSFWLVGHVRGWEQTKPSGAWFWIYARVQAHIAYTFYLFLPLALSPFSIIPYLTSAFLAPSINQVLDPSLIFTVLVLEEHYAVNQRTELGRQKPTIKEEAISTCLLLADSKKLWGLYSKYCTSPMPEFCNHKLICIFMFQQLESTGRFRFSQILVQLLHNTWLG